MMFRYWNTVRYLKPGQIYHRVRKMLNMRCSLRVRPAVKAPPGQLSQAFLVRELDFDPALLDRFPVGQTLENNLTFLHETEHIQWDQTWTFPNRSALWNYNLHYFEFLLPLMKAYEDTREQKYLRKAEECIDGWINANPRSGGGAGWAAYTVSLRLTNWLSCYSLITGEGLLQRMADSMYEQYRFLASHLEKDLLGNHYFENIKTLLLCALFFGDAGMEQAARRELKRQCAEQILADGMHFELSPMYHKIILEDVIRAAVALRNAGKPDAQIESYIPPMLDAAYSLEAGLDRLPLFNDCGNNVAKSLPALTQAVMVHFALKPRYRSQFPESGCYIFRQGNWKLIVDAGQPGPGYIPGHAHCDAMSFELFADGKPVLVNCGTYAYQCGDRLVYKSTASHNTVMRKAVEQSDCWASFRMAGRARVTVKSVDDTSICMEMTDWMGGTIVRQIHFHRNGMAVCDEAKGQTLQAYLHCCGNLTRTGRNTWQMGNHLECTIPAGAAEQSTMNYAPDFGRKWEIPALKIEGKDSLECRFTFSAQKE